jgi:hypothetical protein
MGNTLPPSRPGIDHAIDLLPSAEVPNTRIYPMSIAETNYLRQYVQKMLYRGLIQKSKSTGGAPIVFATKKDSIKLRVYIDYRALNKVTVKNRYPLPLINSLLDKVRTAKYFIKLDLQDAYFLIRIKEDNEYKMAFKTPFSLFEYKVMPFSLCNTPATFQAYIDNALAD